jgi:hypothetical protein
LPKIPETKKEPLRVAEETESCLVPYAAQLEKQCSFVQGKVKIHGTRTPR